MRVIITGGTGLIGSHLAARLVEDRHEVIVLSRHPEQHVDSIPAGVRAERWDSRTAEGWGPLADGAGAIVNLAGANLSDSRWTEAQKQKILESRVNAGQAVVEAVRGAAQKPGCVIQSSGINYYGTPGDVLVTEDSPSGNDFLSHVSRLWEASTAEVDQMGVRRAIIRTAMVLSAEGGALPRLMLPFRLFAGGPMGNGQQWYSWIHINDEVDAIYHLIKTSEAYGPYNLTSPNPVTNSRFAKILGEAMHRPSFLPVPAFALKTVLGEMSIVVLEGQRAVPKRLLESGYQFHFPELKPALEDLI